MRFQRIQDLRTDADLSQKQISEILHISQRSYSHYETGSRNIPIEMLIRLANYYNTSIDYLVGRTDNKKLYHSKTCIVCFPEADPAPRHTQCMFCFSFMEQLFYTIPAISAKLTWLNINGCFQIIQTMVLQGSEIQFFTNLFQHFLIVL